MSGYPTDGQDRLLEHIKKARWFAPKAGLAILGWMRIGLLEIPARSLMVQSTGRSNRGFMLMSPKLVRSGYIPDLSRERKHLKQSNGRRAFVRVQLHFLTNIKPAVRANFRSPSSRASIFRWLSNVAVGLHVGKF
jgi:flagellar assembly factor FliW